MKKHSYAPGSILRKFKPLLDPGVKYYKYLGQHQCFNLTQTKNNL